MRTLCLHGRIETTSLHILYIYSHSHSKCLASGVKAARTHVTSNESLIEIDIEPNVNTYECATPTVTHPRKKSNRDFVRGQAGVDATVHYAEHSSCVQSAIADTSIFEFHPIWFMNKFSRLKAIECVPRLNMAFIFRHWHLFHIRLKVCTGSIDTTMAGATIVFHIRMKTKSESCTIVDGLRTIILCFGSMK